MAVPDSLQPAATPFPGLARAADERALDDLIPRLRADAATRVLVLHGDAAPLASPESLALVHPSDAPFAAEWAFLGRDDNGVAILIAVVDRSAPVPEVLAPAGWGSLRLIGGDLPPVQADMLITALSLGRWLLEAPYCPGCGALATVRNAGWSRSCPDCGREHFPRTDPAVIVAVTSAADPDRLLLGSNALWEAERYSCFAGFVEAGESLEAAVYREVHEEAGVELVDVRYRGSQAWPYPRSLMLGFHATAVDDGAARADGEEIVAVRWFDRQQIGDALAGRGEITLPGAASISRRLIVQWYEGAE